MSITLLPFTIYLFGCDVHILFDSIRGLYSTGRAHCTYCTYINLKLRIYVCVRVRVYVSHTNSLYSFNSEIMFICTVQRMVWRDTTNAIPLFTFRFKSWFFFLLFSYFFPLGKNIVLKQNIEYNLMHSVHLILHHWIETLPRL